jgi:hypothetical protein
MDLAQLLAWARPFTADVVDRSLLSFLAGASRPGNVRLSASGDREHEVGSASCCGRRASPLHCRLGSEDPEGRPRDEMKVEGVVDGSMHAEETLGRRG